MATNLPGVGLPSAKRYYLQRRPQYKHRESYQRDLSAVPQLIDGSPMDEKAQKARQRLEQKLGFFYSSYSREFDSSTVGNHWTKLTITGVHKQRNNFDLSKDVCKEVECGKGTCKPSKNTTFLFQCECDPGWKQTRSDRDDDLKFLPCIIPNCTLDFSCNRSTSPAKEKTLKANESIFDPCFWTDCGGGSCNKTSMFSYTCICDVGYYNILKVNTLPCYKECAIGMDCSRLGISLSNTSTSNTSNAPRIEDNGKNEANLILQGRSIWTAIVIFFMAFVQ